MEWMLYSLVVVAAFGRVRWGVEVGCDSREMRVRICREMLVSLGRVLFIDLDAIARVDRNPMVLLVLR